MFSRSAHNPKWLPRYCVPTLFPFWGVSGEKPLEEYITIVYVKFSNPNISDIALTAHRRSYTVKVKQSLKCINKEAFVMI